MSASDEEKPSVAEKARMDEEKARGEGPKASRRRSESKKKLLGEWSRHGEEIREEALAHGRAMMEQGLALHQRTLEQRRELMEQGRKMHEQAMEEHRKLVEQGRELSDEQRQVWMEKSEELRTKAIEQQKKFIEQGEELYQRAMEQRKALMEKGVQFHDHIMERTASAMELGHHAHASAMEKARSALELGQSAHASAMEKARYAIEFGKGFGRRSHQLSKKQEELIEKEAELAEKEAEKAEKEAEKAEREAEIAEREAEIAERDAERNAEKADKANVRQRRKVERHMAKVQKQHQREIEELEEEKESYDAKMLRIYEKHREKQLKIKAKQLKRERKYQKKMTALSEKMTELGMQMDKNASASTSAEMARVGEEMARLGSKMERSRESMPPWKEKPMLPWKEKKNQSYQRNADSSGDFSKASQDSDDSDGSSSSSSDSDDLKKPPKPSIPEPPPQKWPKKAVAVTSEAKSSDEEEEGSLTRRDDKVWQAVMANNVDNLRSLFRRRRRHILFSLEYRDEQKRTPLMMACTYGFADCMRVLVEHGANVHAVDKKGNTPLHYACINGQFAIVAYLIQHTLASPYEVNKSDATPLQLTRHVLESKPANWLDLAKCIELLEVRCKMFEGYLYESVPNIVADVLNVASLQSWKLRYALVLRNGSRDEVELHLYDVRQGLRPPLPAAIRKVPLENGVQFNRSERWWNRKAHVFLVDQLYEFAALDAANFDMWVKFFETDVKHLVEDRTIITEETQHKILMDDSPSEASGASFNESHFPEPSAPESPSAALLDTRGAWGDSQTSKPAMLDHSEFLAPPSSMASIPTEKPTRSTDYAKMPPTPKKEKHIYDLPLPINAPAASAPDLNEMDPQYPPATRNKLDEISEFAGEMVTEVKASAPRSSIDHGLTKSQSNKDLREKMNKAECIICFDRQKAAVCVPCGHVAVCVNCAETLRRTTGKCPICRSEVREIVKLFMV